jgi:hypothetical protein
MKPTPAEIASREKSRQKKSNYGRTRERLKTLSGEKAEKLKERIELKKDAIARMRAGTLRIYHRIPRKIAPAR